MSIGNYKNYPQEVVLKAIEVYNRPGMVWQNVPSVLAEEFGMKNGDQLYHNHGLCSAANGMKEYKPKRKKRGFISPAKTKALMLALVDMGVHVDINQLINNAQTKIVKPNKS